MSKLDDELIKILRTALEDITELTQEGATLDAVRNRAQSALKEYTDAVRDAIDMFNQENNIRTDE